MTVIRPMQANDRSELISLWSLRFGDSPEFTDWFFSKRFCSAYALCMEEEHRIVCAIHAWPMRLRIRTASIPALMLSGVATLPGYEQRGYMHALMRATLKNARERGFPLVFHKPNRLETYASLSQLPCTRTLFHTVKTDVPSPVFSEDWPEDTLLSVYQAATAGYSGCVLRGQDAMRLKLADYQSDHARLITVDGGYAVLFEQDGGWYGEEVLAVSVDAYRCLLQALPTGALVKLPPDLPFPGETRAQNAMGATDVPKLLKALCGDPSMIFQIDDPAVKENNGIFDGCGQRSREMPALTLSSGALVQLLCGYTARAGFQAQTCFCVDEY